MVYIFVGFRSFGTVSFTIDYYWPAYT